MPTTMAPRTAALLFLGILACMLHQAEGFAVGPGPQQQRTTPSSPYERRDRPSTPTTTEDTEVTGTALAGEEPFILGPGSRVAVAGAER